MAILLNWQKLYFNFKQNVMKFWITHQMRVHTDTHSQQSAGYVLLYTDPRVLGSPLVVCSVLACHRAHQTQQADRPCLPR